MTKLSVNVNKIATLRNARGTDVPNVLEFAMKCVDLGVESITVHPRPDERHITRKDVYILKKGLPEHVELNVEGYPSADFFDLVSDVLPAQVTLVPDPPNTLTSNTGWDCIAHETLLSAIIERLNALDIRTALFTSPDVSNIQAAARTGTACIELYTESFATSFGAHSSESNISLYAEAAKEAYRLGLRIHAGHDLSLKNLGAFVQHVPNIAEVSIGHALITECIYHGVNTTISQYLTILSHASTTR